MPVATATALPPDEPPGMRVCVPWITRRAEMRIVRRHAEGNLVRVGLAHDDGARGLELLNYRRVFIGNDNP